jgi:hypothetical protein
VRVVRWLGAVLAVEGACSVVVALVSSGMPTTLAVMTVVWGLVDVALGTAFAVL